MKPLIIDNFLSKEEFNPLTDLVLNNFQWKYINYVDYADDKDKFQFIHRIYEDKKLFSPFHEIFNPIWNKIRPKEIYRVKANLLIRTPEIVPNRFHIDIRENWREIPYTTSIFYVNTNNGYTEFEDGKLYKSEKNTILLFNGKLKHRAAIQTDTDKRININIDYE